MPLPYARTPFDTSLSVYVIGFECSSSHQGGRDLGFTGIQWGTPVYAVEPGEVVSVNRSTNFYSEIDQNNPDRAIPNNDSNCWAHFVTMLPKGIFMEQTCPPNTFECRVGNL